MDLHRHLQSSVGTQARLGYAAFDVQLQKVYFVTALYAIRTIRNNPGNARACRYLCGSYWLVFYFSSR